MRGADTSVGASAPREPIITGNGGRPARCNHRTGWVWILIRAMDSGHVLQDALIAIGIAALAWWIVSAVLGIPD